MANFHITKDGKVSVCKATVRGCPLGGEEIHFDNQKDAEEHLKNKSIKEHGLLPSVEESEVDQEEPGKAEELVPNQKVGRNLYYVKTDRNGTQIFHDFTCPRCGGAGGSDMWKYTGWDCYSCGGTGKRDKPQIVRKYTEEYEKKLSEKRRKAAEKRALENPQPEPVVEEEKPVVEVIEEPALPKYESKYIGEVGEKITTKVEITDSFSFAGAFGRTYAYKFRDEEGNVVMWMTGSPIEKFEGFKEMTAKVKSHQIYDEDKQTSVIRPKFK